MTQLNRYERYFKPLSLVSLLISLLLFLLIWLFASRVLNVHKLVLPDLADTLNQVFLMFSNKQLIGDVTVSLLRVMAGFGLAVLAGVPLGVIFGSVRSVRLILEPHLNMLRFIPAASLIPLLILWFGVGETGKIVLLFVRALPYLVLYISSVAMSVEKDLLEVAKVLGANQKQILTKVILPRIAPQVWDICRIEFGSSWATLILAEVLGADTGLGYRLVLAQRYIHVPELFALIFLSGLIALVIDALLRFAHRKLFPWSEKARLAEV